MCMSPAPPAEEEGKAGVCALPAPAAEEEGKGDVRRVVEGEGERGERKRRGRLTCACRPLRPHVPRVSPQVLEQTIVLPVSVDEIPDIFVYVLYRRTRGAAGSDDDDGDGGTFTEAEDEPGGTFTDAEDDAGAGFSEAEELDHDDVLPPPPTTFPSPQSALPAEAVARSPRSPPRRAKAAAARRAKNQSSSDRRTKAKAQLWAPPIAVCYARLSAHVLLRETSPTATRAAPGKLRWVPLARDALTAPAALAQYGVTSGVWQLRVYIG